MLSHERQRSARPRSESWPRRGERPEGIPPESRQRASTGVDDSHGTIRILGSVFRRAGSCKSRDDSVPGRARCVAVSASPESGKSWPGDRWREPTGNANRALPALREGACRLRWRGSASRVANGPHARCAGSRRCLVQNGRQAGSSSTSQPGNGRRHALQLVCPEFAPPPLRERNFARDDRRPAGLVGEPVRTGSVGIRPARRYPDTPLRKCGERRSPNAAKGNAE